MIKIISTSIISVPECNNKREKKLDKPLINIKNCIGESIVCIKSQEIHYSFKCFGLSVSRKYLLLVLYNLYPFHTTGGKHSVGTHV